MAFRQKTNFLAGGFREKLKNAVILGSVFSIGFLIFVLFQFSTYKLAGVDVYYHLKYAQLLWQRGLELFNSFPWMQLTVLNQYPTDIWAGYHFYLSLFTPLADPILIAKLSTALLAAGVLAAFFWVLSRLKIRYPLLWTSILLIASPVFFFRLNFSRGLVLAVLFFILVLGGLLLRRRALVFIASALLAFSHPSFPFIWGTAVIFGFTDYITKKRVPGPLLGAVLGGTVLGALIRPQPFNALVMTYYQDVTSFVLRLGNGLINFGVEFLTPLDPFDGLNLWYALFFISIVGGTFFLFTRERLKKLGLPVIFTVIYVSSFLVFLLFVHPAQIFSSFLPEALIWPLLAILVGGPMLGTLMSLDIKKVRLFREGSRLIFLFLQASVAVGFSFISLRFLEQAVPVVVLGAALLFDRVIYDRLCYLLDFYLKKRFFRIGLDTLIGLVLLLSFVVGLVSVVPSYSPSYSSFDRYKRAAFWLRENARPGERIFHVVWSNFPQLFFYNDKQYYLYGMDPSFGYLFDKELYHLHGRITSEGRVCYQKECEKLLYSRLDEDKRVALAIRERFKSRYIFVDRSDVINNNEKIPPSAFESLLEASPYFGLKFRDPKYPGVSVYQLLD